MAERFEPYHVPQQSRRDKLRVNNPTGCIDNLNISGCAATLLPLYDPSLIPSDLITCNANLHRQSFSLGANTSAGVKDEGTNMMGFVGGMNMVSAAAASPPQPANSHLYVDPPFSVELNPSSTVQDINASPFVYSNYRALDQSYQHGNEVVVYNKPEPVLSTAHHHEANSNSVGTIGQSLSLSLSSNHTHHSNLPLELNLHHQRFESSIFNNSNTNNNNNNNSTDNKGSGGGYLVSENGGSASIELSRSSVPLGPFTGYASVLKGSRFLKPAQQLLEEFCDVGGRGAYTEKMTADSSYLDPPPSMESLTGNGVVDDSLSCIDGGERKKSRLISMLDEYSWIRGYPEFFSSAKEFGVLVRGGGFVHNCWYGQGWNNEARILSGRRVEGGETYIIIFSLNFKEDERYMYIPFSKILEVYKKYKNYYLEMQTVVASFESVAGLSSAAPFAYLALKAMCKHFKSLKNAISDQLQFSVKSHGKLSFDRDETQRMERSGRSAFVQRPFHGPGFVDQPVWRPQRGLPERAVTVLRAWLFEHFLHPYPTDTDKLMLAKQTGLSRNQVSNWFINARVRLWKPMVEEIHTLETRQNQKTSSQREEQTTNTLNDQLPTSYPIEYENASSSTKRIAEFPMKRTREDLTETPRGSEGLMNSPYDNLSHHPHIGIGISVGGVSLSLGLHQNGGGLSDSYTINAARRFGLDSHSDGFVASGFGTSNRPFGRDVMGGQLLHDFVG